MMRIEYFAAKLKAEREAVPTSLAPENPFPFPMCNGERAALPDTTTAPIQLTSLVNAGKGMVLDVGGPTIALLTSSEEDAYCVMKGTIPAGVRVPLHSHGDAESFYLLSGEAQVLAQTERGLEWQTIQRGDFAHIPDGTKHPWRNLSSDPAEVIVTTTPKLGRFLREMGETVKAEGGDGFLEKLQCLSERYGYWLGSPEENASVGISLLQVINAAGELAMP